jgi:hypothetical protein
MRRLKAARFPDGNPAQIRCDPRGRPRKGETCPRCGGIADEFADVLWPRDFIAKLHVTIFWKCAGCAAEWDQGYMIRPAVQQGRRRQRLTR